MKTILVVGSFALLASVVAGCGDSGDLGGKAVTAADKVSIVGVWNCVTKSSDGTPDMADSKTFGADGQYSSSRFPEGKGYGYRLEGDKLIVSMPSGDWTEKVKRLAADALEYSNEKSGQTTTVSCKK